MEFGIAEILKLIGSLGVFLFGMKLMSESLQKVAGNKLRRILAVMTSNRFKGIFTGFLITSIIQSSSATTVMIVSFVNAGLLELLPSIGVIMGANIGTTITGWLISILGFKVKMSALALPLIGIGFPLIFSKVNKLKAIGEIIIGFSFIFIGLQYLKDSVPDIRSSPEVLDFLASYTSGGLFSLLLFLFIGTILTIIIQSSSATMALTLVLCYRGIIPFELAAAMVLGENIGTTVTANLAALVTNNSARRAALAHLIFNLFGVVWIIMLFTPMLKLISKINLGMGGENPFVEMTAIPVALSLFHSVFNITNTLILVWFAPSIEKIVIKLIPQKEDDEEFRLKFINLGTLSTSELGILQARDEISVFLKRAIKMFSFIKKLLHADSAKKFNKIYERIEKYEEIIDRMELEIANFLTKLLETEVSKEGSRKIVAMLRIVNEIESIGDCCFNMARTLERKRNQKAVFKENHLENLEKMLKAANQSLIIVDKNLSQDFHKVKIDEANKMEQKINTLRDVYKSELLEDIKTRELDYSTSTIYSNLISENEKMGDYAMNITEAIIESK